MNNPAQTVEFNESKKRLACELRRRLGLQCEMGSHISDEALVDKMNGSFLYACADLRLALQDLKKAIRETYVWKAFEFVICEINKKL